MTTTAAGVVPVPSGWSDAEALGLVLNWATALAALKPLGGEAALTTRDLIFTHHARIKGLHVGALAAAAPSVYRSVLAEIEALIGQGVYAPGSPRRHPLAEGRAVLQALESGTTHGKHALDPWR